MANLTSMVDDSSHNMTNAILDFTTNTLQTPGMTEDESSIMSWSSSESEETPSLSLPSVPLSIQAALPHAQSVNSLARCTSVSSMTMKEFDNKLNELRKENFNLKLRLYFLEKERNGITKPECESFVQQELTRKEQLILKLEEEVRMRENEIKSIKSTSEKSIKKLNAEWKNKVEQITKERDEAVNNLATTTTRLETTSSVAKSLMDHLTEIRDFWKHNLHDLNSSKEMIKSLNNWFNSSEDVLNSASVLITDEQENQSSYMNRSHCAIGDHVPNLHRHLQTSEQACLPSSTLFSNPVVDYQVVQEMYQNYREQFYQEQQQQHLSSESDDWSEPNREVSRARIGLDVIDDPDSCLIYPPSLNRYSVPPSLCPVIRAACSNTALHKKPSHKTKRKTSGMSSMGLLSDLSGLIDEADDVTKTKHHHQFKRPHPVEPVKVDVSLQTDLKFSTITAIFKDYNELVNKEMVDTCVQVDLIDKKVRTVNGSTQTEVKRFVEKSIPVQCDLKEPSVTKSTSSSDLIQVRNACIQSEVDKKSSRSIQTQVTESQVQATTHNRRAHFESEKFFSPCREMMNRSSNEADITTFKEISTNGRERVEKAISTGLYTYKLTDDKKISPKSRIPIPSSVSQALNCSNFQLTPTSSIGSKSCPNTPSSPPASSPFNVHGQVSNDIIYNDVQKSKSHGNMKDFVQECRSLQNDINQRHYSTSSSSSTSSIHETAHNYRRTKTAPLLSPLHEVSLSEEQKRRQEICLNRRLRGSNLEVKTTLGCNNVLMPDCCCSSGQSVPSINSLSSPDLGIGESDDNREGKIKACLSLSNYQRLRGLINESICVMNTLEGVHRDFALSILSRSQFILESTPHLTSLSQLLSSAKVIFKSIYINDNCGKVSPNGTPPGKKQTTSKGTMAKSDHDTDKLIAQLESLKIKKQKMERAITRQLQKTDHLLKKAAAINEITD